MKNKIIYPILLVVTVSLLFTGCAKHVTKGEKFPLMYEEKPVTILVLPPMNHSRRRLYFIIFSAISSSGIMLSSKSPYGRHGLLRFDF